MGFSAPRLGATQHAAAYAAEVGAGRRDIALGGETAVAELAEQTVHLVRVRVRVRVRARARARVGVRVRVRVWVSAAGCPPRSRPSRASSPPRALVRVRVRVRVSVVATSCPG